MERGRFKTNEQVHIMCCVGMGVTGKKNRGQGHMEYGQDALLYWVIKEDLMTN